MGLSLSVKSHRVFQLPCGVPLRPLSVSRPEGWWVWSVDEESLDVERGCDAWWAMGQRRLLYDVNINCSGRNSVTL